MAEKKEPILLGLLIAETKPGKRKYTLLHTGRALEIGVRPVTFHPLDTKYWPGWDVKKFRSDPNIKQEAPELMLFEDEHNILEAVAELLNVPNTEERYKKQIDKIKKILKEEETDR